MPGYDHSAFWARAGILHKLTVPGHPPPAQRSAFGDNVTAMLIAGAISAALFARERTGVGQEIDFSLYQTGVWVLSSDIHCLLHGGGEMPPADRTKAINPLRNIYRTADGRWVQFVMPDSDKAWPNVCAAIGRPELADDPRFNSADNRATNNIVLIRLLDEELDRKPLAEWVNLFKKHNLIFGIANNLHDVINDPQALANNFFAETEHARRGRIKLINSPAKFSKTPAAVRGPAPDVGEHTDEVLSQFGYTREQLAELRRQGIIGQAAGPGPTEAAV